MSKKLPLNDFRAIRSKLEPHEFAISEGQDAPPSDLAEADVWNGIMHLPEDVSIRVSDHNGTRLRLLYGLNCDWTTAIGTPGEEDELYSCMLDAGDCFQCATFNFLHGFYRAALAELRTAFELVMIGAYGNRNPASEKYLSWKAGTTTEFGFTQCRKGLLGSLKKEEAKWLFEKDQILASASATIDRLLSKLHCGSCTAARFCSAARRHHLNL
jgi:hypothetical protein